jgi:hypothetical protein
MISLTSLPERIVLGETLKVKLNITGQINIKTYKGTYFNINIKKNGGTLGTTTLYPLKFNGNSLEWEINPYSYGSDGTFNVGCAIQDGPVITTSTFVVEPDCVIKDANTCNNLTTIIQSKEFKNSYIKKEEILIDHSAGCSIQQPGITYNDNILKNQMKLKDNIEGVPNNENLIKSSKVQKAFRDC